MEATDDKQPQIGALQALLARPDVDAHTRRRIEQEIGKIRAGAAGERDAAYEIEFHYSASRNRLTIHDLRIELDGRVAQVDHLVLNRLLDIWVLESKHFAEGVSVNEHGEWESFYGRRAYGIASPVEQNRRHIEVLHEVFAKGIVPLPRRLGVTIKPRIESLVVVSNGARILRPKGKAAERVDGLESVVKVERLFAIIEKDIDERSITAIGKVVGTDTIERLARDLAALHKPLEMDWAARFGLPAEPPVIRRAAGARPAAVPDSSAPGHQEVAPRPVCASCGRRVSDAVIAYSEAHADRFGGEVYCMDCQRQVR